MLVTEALEHDYFVKALVDTGSAINIITESTYLQYFSKYEMSREKCGINYGGLNKSPLVVSGYITPRICIKSIPDHIFTVRLAVVADSTMTYALLLGREFIWQPELTLILNETDFLKVTYDEPVADILNIEVVESTSELDTVAEDLDSSLIKLRMSC